MPTRLFNLYTAALLLAGSVSALAQSPQAITNIQLGPRPYFLVSEMSDGPLKAKLQSCANGPFEKTSFSIGHRGAALMFPEHTRESYEAAARMGAVLWSVT